MCGRAAGRDAGGMSAVIEVQHLHKRHGDTVAAGDVSFTVHEDEIFGILGPNGAGKTTIVECIVGLVASGTTNRQAAARLFLTEATVKTHLLNIYAKLGISDRAAAEAFNRGLLGRRS
jgi:ABC-type branched-subunit amino acid transport system ATPase component